MRTRDILIGLVLAVLLLALFCTLTDERDDPVRPSTPAGVVEPPAPEPPSVLGETDETIAETATTPAPGEAGELALTGSVSSDRDGEPIVGARVVVYDRRPLYEHAPWLVDSSDELLDLRTDLTPVAETRTEGLGTFRVVVPAPGSWAVVVSHPPFQPACRVMRPGEDQWFELRESARMSFQVVDEADLPVAGARAFILDSDPSSPRFHAVSDSEGRFEVEACPRYDEMLIRADGYADRLVEDMDEWKGEPIVLRAPYRIAGIVLDHQGCFVDGASVVLMDRWGDLRMTGADGRFSFDRVAYRNSDAWLDVRHPRLGALEVQVTPGDEEVVVRFGAPSRFTVAGRFDSPSTPEGSEISLHAWARWPDPNLTKEVSSTDFRITGRGGGTLELKATALRRIHTVCGDLRLRTAEGSLTLTIPRDSTVEGAVLRLDALIESYIPLRVVDEAGKPIWGLWISFENSGAGWAVGFASRRNGLVMVRLPYPAGTPVTLRTGGGRGPLPIYDVGHDIDAVTTLEPDVPPKVVVVRRSPEFVLEARDENGRPLSPGIEAKFLVQQSRWSNYAGAHPKNPRCATAPLLPHESFQVTARAAGRGTVCRSFGPPGAKPRTIPISLPPEGLLRGRLLTAAGRPVARAVLGAEVFREGERVGYSGQQEIHPDGRFEVRGLCSGRVRLSIGHNGKHAAEVFADVVAGQVTDIGVVRIGDVTVLRGTVFGANLRGLGGVEVRIRRMGTDHAGTRWHPIARTHTRRDGAFELPVPWRADHEVVFSKSGSQEVRLPFERKQFENPLEVTLVRER